MKTLYPIKTVRSIPKKAMTPHERLILILLMDMQRCQQIYISAAVLAQESGLSEATVKRIFGAFKEKAIMSIEKRRHGQSYRFVKKLNLAAIEAMAGSSAAELELDDTRELKTNAQARLDIAVDLDAL